MVCATYARACGQPIGAANLCPSLVELTSTALTYDEAAVTRATDVLERTGGDAVNRFLVAGPPA